MLWRLPAVWAWQRCKKDRIHGVAKVQERQDPHLRWSQAPPLLRPGGCLEPLLWPCGGFCLRAWRLLGLLGYRLPAKLGVVHAGVARVGLCAGKRQAATLEQQGLTATGLGATGRQSIGSIVRVWRLANGRLERPNNRRYVHANSRL